MFTFIATVGLALAGLALSEPAQCHGRACQVEDDQAVMLQSGRLHDAGMDGWDVGQRALGVLGLDGYYWPTQPGDINDLRTWCTVQGVDGEDYRCKSVNQRGEDEFSLQIATVVNGSWPKIQLGKWSSGLEESFTQAVQYLLTEPSVHAITGQAGWFTWYQYNVSKIMRKIVHKYKEERGITLKMKPWLGGSPAMLAALGSLVKGIGNEGTKYHPIFDYDLLKKPNDRLLLITSNTVLEDTTTLTQFMNAAGIPVRLDASETEMGAAIRDQWGLMLDDHAANIEAFIIALIQIHGLFKEICDEAEAWKLTRVTAGKIIVLSWGDSLGYGLAVVGPGAMFHNVANLIRSSSRMATKVLSTILNYTRAGQNVVGIIMESTEMPAYSNWVRNITELPVWDSTVVGKCLMAAAPDFSQSEAERIGITPALFNTKSFHSCAMGWWKTDRWHTDFGYQKNGSILYYDTLGLTPTQIDHLACMGGRHDGASIGRLMTEFDTGKFGPPKVHASCLTASPCAARSWQGTACSSSQVGGQFPDDGGCMCGGSCASGYYCGGDKPFNISGFEGVSGGMGYVYGIRGS